MSQTVSGTDTKWIPKWSSDGDERGFRIEYSLIELDGRQPWIVCIPSLDLAPDSRSFFMREKLTLELRCGPINKRARMDLDGDGYCWMVRSVKRPTKGPTLAYILACGKAALKSNGFQGSKKCSFVGFYQAMDIH